MRRPPPRVRAGLFALALAAGTWGVFRAAGGDGPGATSGATEWVVGPRDVRRTVVGLGELVASRSTVVKSRLPGADARILWLVEDGSEVREGDVLVRLDASGFETDLTRARADLEAARATAEAARQVRLAEEARVEQQVAAAAAKVETARLRQRSLEWGEGPIELRRLEAETAKAKEEEQRWVGYVADLEKIVASGLDVAGELRTARRKLDELAEKRRLSEQQLSSYRDYVHPTKKEEAALELADAEAELLRARRSAGFDVLKADSDVKKARALVELLEVRVAELERHVEDATLKAPGPGLVVLRENPIEGRERKPQVGDRVFQDLPLLELPDTSSMDVRARVREIDLERLRVGQGAEVVVEAFPAHRYKAELRSLGALAQRRDGKEERYFTVNLGLVGSDRRLRPGMTARVTIVVEEQRAVLAVPREALRSSPEGLVCVVRSGGKLVARRVETGLVGDSLAEVRRGLSQGDVVVRGR